MPRLWCNFGFLVMRSGNMAEISYDTYRQHMEKLAYKKKLFMDKDKERLEAFRKYSKLQKECTALRNELMGMIPDKF